MRILPVFVVLASVAGSLRADDTSALINEALDKNVNLQVDGMLPDVLKTIDTKTGVPLRADHVVYDLLPWGEQTNIKATIENQTLRQALIAITRKLGLTFELGQYDVQVKPMPALARLGRRATLSELQALDLLSSTPSGLKNDHVTVQELVDAIDQKLAGIKSPAIAVELRTGDVNNPQFGVIRLDQRINVPRNATLAEALEELAQQSDATWYPWGRNIVVVPKQDQVRMQLGKSITARWDGEDIGSVLEKLSERIGVPFTIEPGAIQRVPAEYRTIRLQLENVPVRQVLDRIRGVTGLDYVVKPDGIYVWNQNPNSSAGVRGANDPVVATLTLDGGLQLFLRESQVPADLRAYIHQKTQNELDRLRQRMKDEGFVPTTQPSATQPTAVKKEKDL